MDIRSTKCGSFGQTRTAFCSGSICSPERVLSNSACFWIGQLTFDDDSAPLGSPAAFGPGERWLPRRPRECSEPLCTPAFVAEGPATALAVQRLRQADLGAGRGGAAEAAEAGACRGRGGGGQAELGLRHFIFAGPRMRMEGREAEGGAARGEAKRHHVVVGPGGDDGRGRRCVAFGSQRWSRWPLGLVGSRGERRTESPSRKLVIPTSFTWPD